MLLKRRARAYRRVASGSWISLFLLLACAARLSAQTTPEPFRDSAGASQSAPEFSRPGLGNLPRDLARNAVRLFSQDNIVPLAIGMGASLAVHPADRPVREYFDQSRLGHAGDIFGAKMGNGAVVAAAVGTMWAVSRRGGTDEFSRFSYDLAQASALNALVTTGLKVGINRERPSGHSYSFPSGHTSSAFAAAAVIDHYYGWKTSVAGYAAASFVGFSRIDSGKHHLSDVVAGATLGYIVGRTVTGKDNGDRRFQWTPIVSPSSRTAGVQMSWDLGK